MSSCLDVHLLRWRGGRDEGIEQLLSGLFDDWRDVVLIAVDIWREQCLDGVVGDIFAGGWPGIGDGAK